MAGSTRQFSTVTAGCIQVLIFLQTLKVPRCPSLSGVLLRDCITAGNCAKREPDGATLYNTYYQWVAIFLVVQACLFYIPRVAWLRLEGGLMKFLVKDARGKIIDDAQTKRDNLILTFQVGIRQIFIIKTCVDWDITGAPPQQV